MKEIVNLLPVLFIAMTMNIAAGAYFNISVQKIQFDIKTLISGIVKAAIIGGMFVGTAYCFDVTDLSVIGVEPKLIMQSAIVLYVSKAVVSLGKILGIDIKTN